MDFQKPTPKLRFPGFTGFWVPKSLGEVCKVNQGLQIPISERFLEPAENRYFYITNEFLKKGSQKSYYIESPNMSVICEQEDILMTRTGNTGMVVTGVRGAFHNNFFKININKKILDKDYLALFLRDKKTQYKILSLAGQSTIPDLNHKDFYSLTLNIPSLEEQKKIAAFFSLFDLKIEKLKEKIEQLELFKKGMLQKIFSLEYRFKDENGQDFPEWGVATLGDLGSFVKSYSFSRNMEGVGEYHHIHYGDIHSKYKGIIDSDTLIPSLSIGASDTAFTLLGNSDVIFADASEDTADLGKSVVLLETNNRTIIGGLHTHCFRSGIRLDPLFLHYFTQTVEYRKFIIVNANGVSVFGLSKTALSALELPLPDLNEQIKISSFMFKLSKKISLLNQKVIELEQMKNGFLSLMFV